MNLLHVIHFPVFGGPHNEVLRLATPLGERGWISTVLLPDEADDAARRLRSARIDVIQAPLHRLRADPDPRLHATLLATFPAEVRKLRRVIAERRIDLVVIRGLVNPHGAIAARLEGVPVVWQLVDTRPPWLMRRALMPLVLNLADGVMFTGDAILRAHTGGRPLDLPYTTYVPPVDTLLFASSPSARTSTRRSIGLPVDAPVVGSVANVNPDKGLEYFVRAASIIFRERPDAWFLLVGSQYDTHLDYAERLRSEVSLGGIPTERFIFAGPWPNIQDVYPALDVKLITSRSEGIATTAIEAMACGVPVIATAVGGLPEIVHDGRTGFVVPSRDPASLAERALRILDDSELRLRMSTAARQRAVNEFDVSVSVTRYVRVFEAAIRRRSAMTRLTSRPWRCL